MEWWQALVLGVVEGITEYLPVSSTGHLILAQRALGLSGDVASRAYAIVIQSGAILAVLGLYRARVAQVLASFRGKASAHSAEAIAGRRLALMLIAAFLPAGVVGLIADDWIDEHLFGMWPIVCAWAIGGVAILAMQRWYAKKRSAAGSTIDALTLRGAFVVGLFQCVAMCPGTSRSLATILGGIVVGLSIPAAVEFSLLLGVVTLCAATGLRATQDGSALVSEFGWGNLAIGFATAWLSAVIAVRWMVGYLESHGLVLFGVYRIVLAIAVAAALISGVLDAV